MNKTKLAICMADLEYQERFVNCFMKHYNHQYELHVFTSLKQWNETDKIKYAVIITGEYSTETMTDFVERGAIILNLTEDFEEVVSGENYHQAYKFQEVYKIAELIENLVADQSIYPNRQSSKEEHSCIGIYSLTQESYQVPFAALIGNILSEHHRVLLLDLQSYSGLQEMEEGMKSRGLEDLLSAVITGNYSRSRLLEGIRHGVHWDYICATQNPQCLAEGTETIYKQLIQLLVQEFGYQKIIINFGSVFQGQLELMECCQCLYFLQGNEAGVWREKVFFQELRKREKSDFSQRICNMELPAGSGKEKSYQELVEKWNWSNFGVHIRQELETRCGYGSLM